MDGHFKALSQLVLNRFEPVSPNIALNTRQQANAKRISQDHVENNIPPLDLAHILTIRTTTQDNIVSRLNEQKGSLRTL
jgi:hypothetical protein